MSQKSLSKQADSQFVCKLCDMMHFKKYSEIIDWDSDGQKMIVFNVAKMQQLVLPQYFRHNNFASFIRQLNMYNFHKLQKSQLYDNQYTVFQHDIFKKGNERNFHFIQRKKRIKEQQLTQWLFQKKNQHLLDRLNQQQKLSQITKKSIQSLLQFKFTAAQQTKKIKVQLQNVCKQLRDCRSRKISTILKQIREKVNLQMNEQIIISKTIDRFLQTSFLQQKQNKPFFANKFGPNFYPSLLTDTTYKHSYLPLPSNCGFFSHMSFNEGQASQPVFYSNPQYVTQYYYGTNLQKKQEPDSSSSEEDQNSMDYVPEEQLHEILKNQQQKKQKVLKKQEE